MKLEHNQNYPKKDFKTVKEYFKDINNMKSFLKDGCQEFNNNFELLNFINSGSCGLVFEGKLRNSPTNQRVGLKFLMGKILDEKREKNAQKKIKELYFQKKLHHKNITGLFGFYEIKNCSCIAMDYAKYGDLEYFQKKLIQKKIYRKLLSLILHIKYWKDYNIVINVKSYIWILNNKIY